MFILQLLDITSDIIELAYDAGVFARRYVLPLIVLVYVAFSYGMDKALDTALPIAYAVGAIKETDYGTDSGSVVLAGSAVCNDYGTVGT